MEKFEVGEVWWVEFPYSETTQIKHRPAIIIDDTTMAILAMYVTSKDKDNPYCISINDWKEAGLRKQSWTRIDKIVKIDEWSMDRKIGHLSDKDLVKIMQLVSEIITGKFHEFSLVAVKNSSKAYLQQFDPRWNCWLFPYVRSVEDNKANVNAYLQSILKYVAKAEYITVSKHCKYSVSDDVYKIYNHKLYGIMLENIPEHMCANEFDLNGMKYRWMTIEEMEADENIMEKNEDIVAFVKMKTNNLI